MRVEILSPRRALGPKTARIQQRISLFPEERARQSINPPLAVRFREDVL
jgi:hypothetical protein